MDIGHQPIDRGIEASRSEPNPEPGTDTGILTQHGFRQPVCAERLLEPPRVVARPVAGVFNRPAIRGQPAERLPDHHFAPVPAALDFAPTLPEFGDEQRYGFMQE